MNKEKLWGHLLRDNPQLASNPHFTTRGAQQFFNIVWNTAYKTGCFDMARRFQEITEAKAQLQGDDEEDCFDAHALLSALQALQHVEQTLAGITAPSLKNKKSYAHKKTNTKKTDTGGK